MNVRFNYRYLVGLCLAAASFPALASDAPRIAYDPATTSYYTKPDFLKSPVGSNSTRIVTPLLVDKTSDGALKQKMQGGLVIEAKQVRAPFSAYVKAGVDSTKIAASRCLSSMRCNVGLVLAGEGLSKLLDGLDWVMTDGGKIQKLSYPKFSSSRDDLLYQPAPYSSTPWKDDFFDTGIPYRHLGNFVCPLEHKDQFFYGWYQDSSTRIYCYYSPKYSEPSYIEISSKLIDEAVKSKYIPHETDWAAISGDLPLSNPDVVVGIDSFPDFSLAPETRTIYDADGNPIEVTKTTNTFSFSTNSSSNPSKRPEVSIKEKTTSESFKDGQSQGKTESEKTSSPADVDTPTVVGGGGGKETPTDCAFFPTLCKWLDWTQEDVGDEPDLDKIINDADDFEREYKITGGAASCPAPYKLTIPFFAKTFDVSYQPFCDFATYLRYLFLAFCYFTAARYVVRSI